MGQFLSLIWFRSSNELGLVPHRIYHTSYYNLSSIKLQPCNGNIFVAGNEGGTLLLFDIFSKSELPQEYKVLSFEFGGISELFWLNSDLLVVGTTRGFLVVFSLKNDARRLFEVCHVKAHGDGASQVAVQSIDYCDKSKCLATVGQGHNSIRLWHVADDGILTVRPMESSPIAYCEPRFVAFAKDGLSLFVGYLENMTIRTFSLPSWDFIDQQILGHEAGAFNDRQLGNAMLLEEGRLLIFNLKDGIDVYDSTKFSLIASARFDINGCCSQGISTLRCGAYTLSPSTKGYVNIFRTYDAASVGRISMEGRLNQVQAIHSITDNFNRDVVIASSCIEGRPTKISVWVDGSRKLPSEAQSTKATDYSTAKIVLLCVFVYGLCHLATSMLPPINGEIFTLKPTVAVVPVHGISSSAAASVEDSSPSHLQTKEVDLIPARILSLSPWRAITW